MLRAVDRMIGKDPQCQGHNYIDMFTNERLCGYGTWPGIEHNRGYHINPCWGGYLDLFRNKGEGEIVGDSSIGANPVVSQLGTSTILVKSTKTPGKITLKADFLWKNKNFKRAVKEDSIIFYSIEDRS